MAAIKPMKIVSGLAVALGGVRCVVKVAVRCELELGVIYGGDCIQTFIY